MANFTQEQESAVAQFAQLRGGNMDTVQKSMTTGYNIGGTDQFGGAALRREFLDDKISQLTYDSEQMIFFNKIAKEPSRSTVAQYVVFTRHGAAGNQAFRGEGQIGKITDPNLEQRVVRMKYLSETRQVSLQSTLVDNINSTIAVQTNDAIVSLAKDIEHAALYGDASLTYQKGNIQGGLEFDGLAKLIDPANVIDANGAALSDVMLNDAAVHIAKGYGRPTDAFMPTGAKALFVNKYLDRQWASMTPGAGTQYSVGFNIPSFNSVYGPIQINGSNVMENDNLLDTEALGGDGAPQAPVVTAAVATNKGGTFRDQDLKKKLTYVVTTSSNDAQSAASEEVVVAGVANPTDAVTLTISVKGTQVGRPQYVTIYRQGENTGMFYQIARVGLAESADGKTLTFDDTNATIPETVDVFVGEMSPDVIKLYQMLPMMQLPLAQVNAMLTWTLLWFGALALLAPKKWVHIKNVDYVAVPAN